jgi:hypothetical protein
MVNIPPHLESSFLIQISDLVTTKKIEDRETGAKSAEAAVFSTLLIH